MDSKIDIIITNSLKELVPTYAKITSFCNHIGLSDNIKNDINLIVEELITNTISYGYHDDVSHQILINMSVIDNIMYVEIVNDADAFNPLDYPDPDFTMPPNEREPGGLGIYFAKVLSDEISYKRKNAKNYLTFSKKIK